MKARAGILLLVFGTFLVSGSASAQQEKMYSWTDENGVVHFTDSKPEGQKVRVHDIRAEDSLPRVDAPTDSAAAVAQPGANEPSLGQQRRDEIEKSRQEKQVNQARNEAECASRQAEVAQLEPHRRVYNTNEKGEVERMDDVVRVNRVAEAKAYIDKHCK